jgi:hypothetical protein
VTLSAAVGELGTVYSLTDYAQPWFDEQGSGVYPLYHVIRGMAAAAGAPRLETTISAGASVQAVALHDGGATVLWLANLTGTAQAIEIAGLAGDGSIAILDLDSFTAATAGPDGFVDRGGPGPLGRIELGPYAVARLRVTQ